MELNGSFSMAKKAENRSIDEMIHDDPQWNLHLELNSPWQWCYQMLIYDPMGQGTQTPRIHHRWHARRPRAHPCAGDSPTRPAERFRAASQWRYHGLGDISPKYMALYGTVYIYFKLSGPEIRIIYIYMYGIEWWSYQQWRFKMI